MKKLQADAAYTRVNSKRIHDLATQGIDTKDQDDLAASTLAQTEAAVVAGYGASCAGSRATRTGESATASTRKPKPRKVRWIRPSPT